MTLAEKLELAAKCCFGFVEDEHMMFCGDCPYDGNDGCHYGQLWADLIELAKKAEKKDIVCPNCGACLETE